MSKPKKKKGGLKIVIILLVLVVILGGGTVGGLAFAGKMLIPGVTPKRYFDLAKKQAEAKKRDAKLAADKAEADKKKAEAEKRAAALAKANEPKPVNNAAGQEAVAKLWEGLEPDQLKEITSTWQTRDLAPVLLKMEAEKVAAYLAEIEPKRASELSKEIQRLVANSAS